MAKIRSLVAGPGISSSRKQQISELKIVPKKSCIEICAGAGVQQKSFLSKRVALAMKTSMKLTWAQHRIQKRFLSQSLGVKCESESKIRSDRKSLLSDHLTTKMIKVKEKNELACKSIDTFIDVKVPVVYIRDLVEFVKELLHNYKRTNMLVWEDGMPDDEVWIKVGGDHGGKSFKLCLQICNVRKPNAKQNTFVIACMPAKDVHENLATLATIYKEQIKTLQNERWKKKKIKLFMFGDYAFLSSMFGLSGARGKFFCLWCLIRTDKMQVPLECRGHSTARRLPSMKRDHENFISKGKQDLKLASSYHNVIHEPLWEISIQSVCPPYLHILLGIVKKHHDLLEKDLHEVDLEIAREIEMSKSKLDNTLFHKYIQNQRSHRKLRNELGYLSTCKDSDTVTMSNREIADLDTRIMKLQSKLKTPEPKLNIYSGPLVSEVQLVLKRHRIVQQAYHSRSFVGNHCSKYIKEVVQDDIRAGLQEKVCELSENVKTNENILKIAEKFKKLNSLYCHVHILVGHMNSMSKDNVNEASEAIKQYVSHFRKLFPDSVPPKIHF